MLVHTKPTPGSSTGVLTYKRTSEQALEAAGLPYTIIRCAVLYDAGYAASFCEWKQQQYLDDGSHQSRHERFLGCPDVLSRIALCTCAKVSRESAL